MSIIIKQFKGNKLLSSAEFVTLFKKYDKDGNGFIEANELDHFLKDLCAELGEANKPSDAKQLKKIIMSKYDVNNDGKLSMDEMSKILPTDQNFLIKFRNDNPLTSVDFMTIWCHYDIDKSGYIEGDEIEGFVHDLVKETKGNKKDASVSVAEIVKTKEDILKEIDKDKDGKISLRELSELLKPEENFFKQFEGHFKLSETDFEAIFAHYDQDGNQQIEGNELLAFMKDVTQRDKPDVDLSDVKLVEKQILELANKNKDAMLSKAELRLFLFPDCERTKKH